MRLSMRACVSVEERYLDSAEAGMNLALIWDCRVLAVYFHSAVTSTSRTIGNLFSVFRVLRIARGPFSFSALRSSKNIPGRRTTFDIASACASNHKTRMIYGGLGRSG